MKSFRVEMRAAAMPEVERAYWMRYGPQRNPHLLLRASIGSFPGRPFKRKTFSSSQYSSCRSGADDVSQGKNLFIIYLFN